MSKALTLSKEARTAIISEMRKRSEMTTDEAMELVRPHYVFDSLSAKEQLIRRKANSLMASIRGKDGIRAYFAATKSKRYVNIEQTLNLKDLKAIVAQLECKKVGLDASIKKTRNRMKEIEGQISFQELSKSS